MNTNIHDTAYIFLLMLTLILLLTIFEAQGIN